MSQLKPHSLNIALLDWCIKQKSGNCHHPWFCYILCPVAFYLQLESNVIPASVGANTVKNGVFQNTCLQRGVMKKQPDFITLQARLY